MTDETVIEASRTSRRAVFGSIAISIAFVMELTLVPLVLPAIQAEFGLSVSQLAWVFNSYGFAVAAGVLFGGWFGDTIGVRKVFAVGVFMFALGALIVAFANNYEAVIAARVLQGFGGGVFSPLVPLLLTRAMPDRPGKILIIWGSVTGYAAALAPLVLSQTVDFAGWQSVFVLFAVVSLVALAISGRMRGGPQKRTERARPALSALLKAPNLWLAFFYIACTYGAITFYLFRLPLWLAAIDYEVTTIGFVLAMIWLSFSVVGTSLRNRVDGEHVRLIMLFAPVLIAVSFPIAYLSTGLAGFLLSACLLGAGFACGNAPSTQMVLRFAPKGLQAISASMDITFARIGGVLTVALLAQQPLDASIWIIFGISSCAIICALIVGRSAALASDY
ncbi:MAG: MFS transporter [Roseobacter sp.]